MRGKIRGRILAGILAAVLMCMAVPGKAYAADPAAGTAQMSKGKTEETDRDEEALQEKTANVQLASTRAVRETIDQLRARFPAGKYWNRVGLSYNNPDGVTSTPCPNNHDTAPNTCNNYRGYAQCWGFAYRLADGYYGSCPLDGWSAGSLNSLKAGDVVRRSGHVIWVTGVSGDTVRFADCNGDYHCGIRWDVSTTKSSLSSGIQSIWSAPYSITTEALPPPDEEGSDMPAPFTRTIADGDYHIVTALDNSMCLDIAGASKENGANAQIWHGTEDELQVFTVTWLGADKGYKIIHRNSGKSLDVAGRSRKNGTNVWQWEYFNPSEHTQDWVINEVDNGAYYTIQSRGSGFYLDVNEGIAADGTNVKIWKGNGGTAQKWRLIPAGTQTVANGDYHITTALDDGMCLNVQGASMSDEANVEIARKEAQDSRIFTVTYLNNGFYKILNKHSGKSLDVYIGNAVRGTNVQQFGYHGGFPQQWAIRSAGDGTFYIQPRCSGHYLDVANGSTADGTNVWTTVWMGGAAAQRWKFEKPAGTPENPDIPENPDQPDIPDQPETPGTPGRGEVLEEDVPQGNVENIPQGLWMSEIVPQTYTGKAVRPEVRVYDYKTLLVEKRDYTISYKNNVKAGASSGRNLPTVTVTGRGNYTGKETQTFEILPKQLTDEDVTADSLTVSYTGRAQKPIPVVTWNGKRLVRNRDYKVTYPDAGQAGDYKIRLEGMGNYGGERQVGLTVTLSIPVSKLRVDKIADQTYTGSAVEPVPVVKNGRKVLTQGEDYTLSYQNNAGVGTATVMITGRGDYAGERRVTFRITAGASLNNGQAELAFDNPVVYTGEEVRPDRYTLKVSVKYADGSRTERTLTEGKDFTVSYKNNIRPGTATVFFRGMGGYTGTLKKTYKISACPIGENAAGVDGNIQIAMADSYAYTKGGCKPEPVVTFRGTALKKGTDYTLSYKNNTALNDGSDPGKLPVVTVRGKGCFTGERQVAYKIIAKDIGGLSMSASDKVWQNRKNRYQTKVVIRDVDGKALDAGKDYEKLLTYAYHENVTLSDGTVRRAGEEVSGSDILPAGTVIRVTASAKGGNYTGTLTGSYRIVKSDIGRAGVRIPAQTYTGREIRPDKEMQVKLNGKVLSSDNYEITGYTNNINRGTATVTIRGRNDCGGVKTVRFKIKGKGFRWWWK